MKKASIELIWIVVKDLKKAIEFYTEEVGLTLNELHEEFGWAELEGLSGARLGLAQERSEEKIRAGHNGVMTFTVKSLSDAISHLKDGGGTLIGEVQEIPHHIKMQMVRDRDGNHFQLVERL